MPVFVPKNMLCYVAFMNICSRLVPGQDGHLMGRVFLHQEMSAPLSCHMLSLYVPINHLPLL